MTQTTLGFEARSHEEEDPEDELWCVGQISFFRFYKEVIDS
jgi:hypothetical protein